ncbi:MAG: YolD-like family protein [Holdemanella sp.]|uniref:YolD-like family protein n=1 Tax=Holdemanella sp. TaxID=1971762 RepID=UPI002E78F6C1|nr:YolD-like family protein [Holdemanella sp.]MEE0078994.1 YolD-like family protein [Holdemanella sp.]
MDERWYTMDRPKSKYPKMPMLDRAAQFAPFAALTGHKEAILEQQRLTQTKRILSNEEKLAINKKIFELMNLKSKCRITYFEKDKTKSGGQYLKSVLSFKRIDELNKVLYFKENIQIQIDDIVDIEVLEK